MKNESKYSPTIPDLTSQIRKIAFVRWYLVQVEYKEMSADLLCICSFRGQE